MENDGRQKDKMKIQITWKNIKLLKIGTKIGIYDGWPNNVCTQYVASNTHFLIIHNIYNQLDINVEQYPCKSIMFR